ncbi:Uncharacterised protein [Raoultella terrigena]|uniref:Uncharacterized protein n=1 Tax=Raoultella terrigena TaxID=577 RepID=A0A4U9D8F6_RAOTE|nr:Uncharacterised protein [Raoultella terrigena]
MMSLLSQRYPSMAVGWEVAVMGLLLNGYPGLFAPGRAY